MCVLLEIGWKLKLTQETIHGARFTLLLINYDERTNDRVSSTHSLILVRMGCFYYGYKETYSRRPIAPSMDGWVIASLTMYTH